LTLSPKAQEYYQELQQRRLNPRHHLRQIVALSDLYGVDAVARAMEDAFTFQAFSCQYIANLLESRARQLPIPCPLTLTRRQDLLDLEVPEPNLSLYDLCLAHKICWTQRLPCRRLGAWSRLAGEHSRRRS